ncbi:MAG: nucleoside phosphorylase [Acidobacteriota bacterium]
MSETHYHLGFGAVDLGDDPPTLTFLSGDPNRARHIAENHLRHARTLSENRGLHAYSGELPNGRSVLSCTSGMGAPSMSIVVNELIQVGIETVIRIGTSGSIQDHVKAGSVVVSSAGVVRQGAGRDIAPEGYPAAADPFLTVALAEAATQLDVPHHVGLTASTDTFYEGQERSASSANPTLLRHLRGLTDELRDANVLNFEMEAATLFLMGQVYGFRAAAVCGIIAERTEDEDIDLDAKARAVDHAIQVAVTAAERFA